MQPSRSGSRLTDTWQTVRFNNPGHKESTDLVRGSNEQEYKHYGSRAYATDDNSLELKVSLCKRQS